MVESAVKVYIIIIIIILIIIIIIIIIIKKNKNKNNNTNTFCCGDRQGARVILPHQGTEGGASCGFQELTKDTHKNKKTVRVQDICLNSCPYKLWTFLPLQVAERIRFLDSFSKLSENAPPFQSTSIEMNIVLFLGGFCIFWNFFFSSSVFLDLFGKEIA